MAAQLNHTIVHSQDALASATFVSDVLGLPAPVRLGHFQAITTGNGVSLDFATSDREVTPQHYAFLVTEPEFDEIFGRIQERGLEFWADPRQARPGEINRHHGRGCYFLDPSGHFLEILTVPYDAP